jgi:hypothetical protein
VGGERCTGGRQGLLRQEREIGWKAPHTQAVRQRRSGSHQPLVRRRRGSAVRVFGERSPVSPVRIRVVPEDVEGLRRPGVRSPRRGRGGSPRKAPIRPRENSTNRRSRKTINRSELANNALEYLRLEEGLGRSPTFKEFDKRGFRLGLRSWTRGRGSVGPVRAHRSRCARRDQRRTPRRQRTGARPRCQPRAVQQESQETKESPRSNRPVEATQPKAAPDVRHRDARPTSERAREAVWRRACSDAEQAGITKACKTCSTGVRAEMLTGSRLAGARSGPPTTSAPRSDEYGEEVGGART